MDVSSAGLVLAIDTAGEACAAAIFDPTDGRTLASNAPIIGKGHAERLMDVLSETLAAAGCRYRDIAQIAVGVGPGSFTGIRVGVAAARGLALSLGIEAIGVTSLHASAETAADASGDLLVLRDAKRGEVYALPVSDGHAGEPELLALEDLQYRFGQGGALRLLGSGAERGALYLTGREISIVGTSDAVDPAVLARLAVAGRTVRAAPLYLRGPDAKPQRPTGLFGSADIQ